MKIKKFSTIIIFLLFFIACSKDSEKILEGPLKIEKNKNETILLNDGKIANGIIKGQDTILGLDYEIYYIKGKPSGKIFYYNDNEKMIEINTNIDYKNNKLTGNIKVYEYNGNSVPMIVLEYANIISKPKYFIDFDHARPVLLWYLENPMNIFDQVDIFSGANKISAIKSGKYYFYDENGNSIEVPLHKKEVFNLDHFPFENI